MGTVWVTKYLHILPFVAAVMIFLWMLLLGSRGYGHRILRACEELGGYVTGRSKNMDSVQRCREFLDKNGAEFHLGKWVRPISWFALCVVSGCVGFVMGACFHVWVGLLATVPGCLMPMILLRYLNYRDNEQMISEIKLIYNSLEIQIQAGVYVTDALTECYAGIQNRRLRQGLLELAGAIAVKADVQEALMEFQGRFDNRYIDALCITLLQAMESGQVVDVLRDISEQVKDMEVSVMGRRKAALDRSVTFYQLGILAAVLGIVLYACITRMFEAVQFLN